MPTRATGATGVVRVKWFQRQETAVDVTGPATAYLGQSGALALRQEEPGDSRSDVVLLDQAPTVLALYREEDDQVVGWVFAMKDQTLLVRTLDGSRDFVWTDLDSVYRFWGPIAGADLVEIERQCERERVTG